MTQKLPYFWNDNKGHISTFRYNPMHYKAVLSLVGGILIHLTLGTLYTASNLSTYVISYLHVVKHQGGMDSSMAPWVFAIQSLGQALCMLVGGTLQRLLGIKRTILLGCFLVSFSTFVAYWTVNNFYGFCATYGLLFGVGVGIAYSSPMTAAMKWLPNNRGLANGLIVLGFGIGSLIFNFVETFVINPHNIRQVVDPTGVTTKEFFPEEVVSHVPKVFIILGICYSLLQIVGFFCISEPTEEEKKMLTSETAEPIVEQKKMDGMKTKDAIKTPKFWQIWITFLGISMTNIFVSSFYKFFGQSFITDDFFLVVVGSISSVCNGLCRPFWGWISDRFGYKKAMSSMLSIFFVLIGTFSLSKYGGKWVFMIYVCALYWCIGGAFAMIPTFTDRTFGSEYFGPIYGCVFTSIAISSVFSAFFVMIMVKKIGVMGISVTLACLVLISLLVTSIPKAWSYRDGIVVEEEKKDAEKVV